MSSAAPAARTRGWCPLQRGVRRQVTDAVGGGHDVAGRERLVSDARVCRSRLSWRLVAAKSAGLVGRRANSGGAPRQRVTELVGFWSMDSILADGRVRRERREIGDAARRDGEGLRRLLP